MANPDPFAKYAAMLAPQQEAPTQAAPVETEPVDNTEAMSAEALPMDQVPAGDPFANYAAMLNPQPDASTATDAEPTVTKKLQGFISQNVMGPLGINKALEDGGKMLDSIKSAPGEIAKDPVGGIAAIPAGIMSGLADAVDTGVNLSAEAARNPYLSNFLPPALGVLAPRIQKAAGGPLDLRGKLASQPMMQDLQKAAPNTMQLASGVPMAAATIATGGEGLAGRALLGAGENIAQSMASTANRQIQGGAPVDLGAAFNDAKGAGWLGAVLAGVLGRRAKPETPKAPGTNPKWLGDLSPEAQAQPIIDKLKQYKEQPKSPTARSGVTPYDKQLPAAIRQTGVSTFRESPTSPAAYEKQLPAPIKRGKLANVKRGKMQSEGEPSYNTYRVKRDPRLTGEVSRRLPEEPIDVSYEPVSQAPGSTATPAIAPKLRAKAQESVLRLPMRREMQSAPRVSDFTKRIKKGGDMAHSPGVPGFRRVKGASGQSKNKVELLDHDGKPITGADGKPVSWSWKTLDDAAKPKPIPERLVRELEKARENQPTKIEPETPKEVPPPPKREPAAPEPKEAPKGADAIVEVANKKIEKLESKAAGIEERAQKIRSGDIKNPGKNKKGEAEPDEVRAARADNYAAEARAQKAAIESALARYKEAVTKPAEHGVDYGEAALQGLIEHLEKAGENVKDFITKEEGSGEVGVPVDALSAGLKFVKQMSDKADIGEGALAQQWHGFAARVAQSAESFFGRVKTVEGRTEISNAIKGAAGLMNDFDIIQKFDPTGLSVDMSRSRAALEAMMYDAKLPKTVAEREAFARTSKMSAEEILTDPELPKSLSAEQIEWAAGVKQIADSMLDDVKLAYSKEDIEPNYKGFLKNFYEDMTNKGIERGERLGKPGIEKASRIIKNGFYDNIVKGNWGIHSIHVWDAVVHGGSYLGRHFWSGAHKSYSNPTVKAYVRGYKGSGLMKSARSGDAPTIIEKTIGKPLEELAAKNKVVGGALKIGRALEGGWLEGEKMHVLRAGVLERTAKDMGVKGGAEGLIKKLQSGEMSPAEMLEMNNRQAQMLSDIIGYNPTGITNRNAFQRQLGPLGKIIQPFVGMRSVQSRLLYDSYAKAFQSGKIADLKQAAAMHGLLLATGGASTLTRMGKYIIGATAGPAALAATEQYLDGMKIIPGINVAHLTPDMVPYLFAQYDNASRMAESLGKVLKDPKRALTPENIGQTAGAAASFAGGSVGDLPSFYNVMKATKEFGAAAKGYKEVAVFDDTTPLMSKMVGKAKIGNYDNWDALLTLISPHDIDKTHHAKEGLIHRARVLDEIGAQYGPKARLAAGKAIPSNDDVDWNSIPDWAKENFDNDEWKAKEIEAESSKEQRAKEKAAASTH